MTGAQTPQASTGLCLAEVLVAAVVLALLAGVALQAGISGQARLRVESASRRLLLGLEMGRAAAEQAGQACGLSLTAAGWRSPSGGELPACAGVEVALEEGLTAEGVRLEHNLPAVLRISSTGLVLDGGSVWLRSEGTSLVRCLVVSPPLGVTRLGREAESGTCLPDPSL